MKSDELIRMANQIADFFEPYGHDDAVVRIAQHIREFWDPRMRTGMAEALRKNADGLTELAREGVEMAIAS
ncbi:formate dehydrogenase subunit delta [Nisaea acidiphila]|uniref:Formate dehydrogenase subunit delta n=1 Tax=Nisaea acidiphila TaxID=1862145 RepID=A0A9J7ANF8_9PROT|nr:formate dehydrogenase subunit delta [Nisaea acidiphila]UUX48968.1 formate dehydrogenase subunit delta [Nisaea acidiphila]